MYLASNRLSRARWSLLQLTTAQWRATMPSGTVCTVVGGPLSGSGYTWYQVQSSFGTGWAASAYLVRI